MTINHTKFVREYDPAAILPLFSQLLPTAYVNQLVANSQKRFYKRILTPSVLLWGFIYQRVNHDHTQDEVVVHLKSGAADHLSADVKRPISQRLQSESTAAYCKGQQRFPLTVLQQTVGATAKTIQQTMTRWHDHPVALLDGTIMIVRPTAALRQHYVVLHNQHGDHYWIQIRGVGAFCLNSGAVLAFTEAAVTTSEQKLAVVIIAQLQPNTVVVGDRNFGIFAVVQAARHHQTHVVFRLTQARARKIAGRALHAADDFWVSWSPSRQDQLNDEMSAEPIAGRVLCCRIQRKGFRPLKVFLFTTLLEQTLYTADELCQLYGLRSHVELNLRYVKEQLDLGELKGKSPDSVRKELYSGLLAYNLIRASMAEAAVAEKISPLTLSFARCWRRLRPLFIQLRVTNRPEHLGEIFSLLLARLRKCKLPQRKTERYEPRAVRTRPRPYGVLIGDRKRARKRYIQELKAQMVAAKC